MTPFEETYLRCASAGFRESDLFLISGPREIREPFSSVEVGSTVNYPAEEIAAAISQLPSMVVVRQAKYVTVWRWENDDRYIEVSVDGDNIGEDGNWIASPLQFDCTFLDLVDFWLGLCCTHPAVYLSSHTCRMYTPCSFLEEPAALLLSGAFRSRDSATRETALLAFKEYRSRCGGSRRSKPYWAKKTPHMAGSLYDLDPPVVPIQCKDFWTGDDWHSRVAEFDAIASAQGLRYFAFPTAKTVSGKYKQGFMVWASMNREEQALNIARSLEVMTDDPAL
jgi:hypothetical protein